MRPSAGILRANEALRLTSGLVLMIPRQFGPISAIPYSAHSALSFASRSTPFGPTSRKPAEMTIAPRMPICPHCSSARWHTFAGNTMTARSTSSSISTT